MENNNTPKFEVTVQASLNFNTANVRISELTKEQYTGLLESISQGASNLNLVNQAIQIVVATSEGVDATGKKETKPSYNNNGGGKSTGGYKKPYNNNGPVKLTDKQITAIKKFAHVPNFQALAQAHEFTGTPDRNAFTDFCFGKAETNASSFQPEQGENVQQEQATQNVAPPQAQGSGFNF